jgi:hypothetical protein
MNSEVIVYVCGLIAIVVAAGVAYWAKDKLGRLNRYTTDPFFLAVFLVLWLVAITIVLQITHHQH